MQDDKIHWIGQPIALVLAETQEEADHAVSLIEARIALKTQPSRLHEHVNEEPIQRSLWGSRFMMKSVTPSRR